MVWSWLSETAEVTEAKINELFEGIYKDFGFVSVEDMKDFIFRRKEREYRMEDIWSQIENTGEEWSEDYPEGIHSGEVSEIFKYFEKYEDSNFDLWTNIDNAIDRYKKSEAYKNFEFRKGKI